MSDQPILKNTYCDASKWNYRLKAASKLLNISENTLRSHLEESGIVITRQSATNPLAPPTRVFNIENIFEIANWRRNTNKVKVFSKRPIVIAISVIKGGVGKSTTTTELGCQLQLRGYKTLIIDVDPQSNTTQLMGYESDIDQDELAEYGLSEQALVSKTFFNLVAPFIEKNNNRNRTLISPHRDEVLKKPFGEFGPHLIASDVNLDDLNMALNNATGDRDHVFYNFFHEALEGKIKDFSIDEYDFILLDCATGTSAMTKNAIASADYVIAPVKMDFMGAKGIARLVSEMNGMRERANYINPKLVILPTFYSDNYLRTGRMIKRLQAYRDNLAAVTIPQSEMFPTSTEYYMPLTLQHPTCAPVDSYRQFAEAFLSNIKNDFN